jgi:hypothetical protein
MTRRPLTGLSTSVTARRRPLSIVMVRLDRTTCINAMSREVARSSRAMTAAGRAMTVVVRLVPEMTKSP